MNALIKLLLLANLVLLNSLQELKDLRDDNIPLYLSIQVDKQINHRQIFDFMLNNLMILKSKYPNDDKIRTDYELIGKRMFVLREPDSWHITTLYIGNDLSKMETKYYKDFIENEEIIVKLLSFAYIPGRLFSAPVFLDYDLIENKFPHMTLILGDKSRAVDSNYLLKALFNDNQELKKLYDNGLIKDENFSSFHELNNVVLDYTDIGEKETFEKVYFIKTKFKVNRMNGKTIKNFKQKN